jgi:PAS domain S-box-containing protein
MTPTQSPRFFQSALHSLLGSAGVVLVSYIGYRLKLDLATTSLLCLMVVVLVSLVGRFVPAALASLVAVLAVNYFFVPPLFTIGVSQPFDEIAVTALLATTLVISRLVTRQRQSLREVETLNEQLQLVVDTIPSLVVRTRGDGSLEFMNQRWLEYLGLPMAEVQDWAWTAALHPEDRERFMEQWRTALSKGDPLESEARMRRADGEYRWLWIHLVPLRDSAGKIVNWYGTSTNIEERKQAEERAHQAERERHIATDTIPALLWSTLPDGSSDFNNQPWLEYTGLSEEEARDWGYTSVIHPEDYQRLVTEWAAHFASGEPIEDEARLRRADGQYRWFLHRAVPLRDEQGNILKWYGTSTDIEDLKRAEEVLRNHARLLDLTHDTVFVRDMSDAITYWNHGAEALYGWSRDEAVGKISHQLTQTIFPAPLEKINEELLRTGRWEGELVHTKRDGTRIVVASRWSLQRDELGRATAILETNNDVTQQKRAEAELRASEGRYRHIFQSAGVSIWEEDFSGVKAAIDDLEAQGITDFREYLARHPDFIQQAISLVKITDVNDTTLTLLEARSKDELLVSLHRIFLPETQEAFAGELITIAEGRTRFEAETVLLTLGGKRLPVLFTITFPAESETLDSVLVSMMDITERKRLDNELRRSQAYLIAAQELGNTGSWARRLSTGEMYWSEEVFRIFGLDSRTTIPTRKLDTQLWHPDDRERADRTINDAQRDKRNYEMDVRVVRPDGSIRYVHIRGQPVFDQAGETDEYIGVVMDITKRKRTERALRRARETALQARFAAVLEERTRLARDIHDTLLQGFTGIALKLVAASNRVTEPPESIAALRDLIGLAQRTLTDARRAVWDLRAPARSAGDFPAALRAAAEDCVRGTKLGLEYDVGGLPRPMDPEVEAVVVRVAQEAITNVVKHAEARTVRVRLSFEERRVRLSVIDDGRGFAVQSDFHAYGGHWGLLGMRERASQVRGKFSLRSTPGHGSELVLLVPYAPGHRSPPASAAASSAVR